MVVVFESILEHLVDLENRAADNGRKISYIALSKSEVDELNSELGIDNKVTYQDDAILGRVCGIQITGLKYHTAKLEERRDYEVLR